MAHILIFGDSITYGAWDIKGGWPQRLRKYLDEKTLAPNSDIEYIVYNLGVSGDTTEELLERFYFETKYRLSEEEENIFIFAIGINDSQDIHSKKGLRVSPKEFRKNLKTIIKKARKISSKIVFIGLNPIDESKVDPIPWATDKSYKNKNIEKFNKIIKSACKENNVLFLDILEKFKQKNYKKLLEDGAHPNTEGHKKIFEIVKSALVKEKII